MEERNIVAIDLGTSKIALAVARVEGNDLRVIYYREHASNGIDRSAVYNEKYSAEAIGSAIAEAEDALGIKIMYAAVCMPKYYIKQITSQAKISRDPDTAITDEDIKALMDIVRGNCSEEIEDNDVVYGIVAQSYSDGEEFQIMEEDIIGLEREELEGNFKIFIGKKQSLKRIDSAFNKLSTTASKKFFTADTTAKAVLDRSEMDGGVALVDLGGGTTSVTIYQGGLMRYYASIPFGGKSITEDIKQECGISWRLAENIKKGYGVCIPSKLQTLAEKTIQVRTASGNDKRFTVKFLSEVITARMTEIIEAVLYQIQESGFADSLRCGIVITGGGANLGNCCNLFQDMSGLTVKLGYPRPVFSMAGDSDGVHDTSATTCIGILLAAREDFEVSYTCQADEVVKPAVKEEKKPEIKKAAATKPEPQVKVEAPVVEQAPVEVIYEEAAKEEAAPEPAKKGKEDELFGGKEEKLGIWDRYRLKQKKEQEKKAIKKREEKEKREREAAEKKAREEAEKANQKDEEQKADWTSKVMNNIFKDEEV